MLEAKDRITRLLRTNRGVAFSGGCLSASLGIDCHVAVLAIESLAHSWEFVQEEWVCFKCRKVGVVCRALPRRYQP
jgi:hypothetical protein